MSSSRLPGKVMLDLGGEPMLSRVVRRVKQAATLDVVCVATSDQGEDDPVAALGDLLGVEVFRGSLQDVLDRYVGAAQRVDAATVVRVTGDCPFIEPAFIDQAVRHHLRTGADYTCAQLPSEFPLGTGNEVVTLAALLRARERGTMPADREHVTWYILAHREEFKVELLRGDPCFRAEQVHLLVDTPLDLALAREIVARLTPENPDFGVSEIVGLWRRDPTLFALNAVVPRNPSWWLDPVAARASEQG